MTEALTELPVVDDTPECEFDHPDDIDDVEAERGLAMYRAVDDLDDESNGLSDEEVQA